MLLSIEKVEWLKKSSIISGDEVPIEIDKNEIMGKILSTVKYFETPTENDQANFEIKGSKYAQYEDSIVVLIDGNWILFINSKNWDSALSIHYDEYLKKDIFGDLSDEEIYKILRVISMDIRKDKDYENNLELIIENAFKEFGIDDSSKLNYAKSGIKITIANKY